MRPIHNSTAFQRRDLVGITLYNSVSSDPLQAGAMVGDAFLHQLPHAFGSGGGGHSHEAHSHAHGHDHGHDHGRGGHAHSIEDLSVGLAVLGKCSATAHRVLFRPFS
jgi:hypothetical protein